MRPQWEQRIAEDPTVRPGPRNETEAEAIRLVEESTQQIRALEDRRAELVDVALRLGAPRAAVAAAAGLTYDQLRMRQRRGQAAT